MQKSRMIYEDVNALIELEGTRDPHDILISRKVTVLPFRMDTNILGMYTDVVGKKFVFYNRRLDETMKRMVLAHELGHNFYHYDYADLSTAESMSKKSNEELEANIFASHLLIKTEAILSLYEEGYDVNEIASFLYVRPELCNIKLNELQKMGYKIAGNFSIQSDFFKNIKGMDEENWDSEFVHEDPDFFDF